MLRLREDAVEWREIEGEIVAVSLSDANYLATNQSGAVLWAALAKGTTKEALVSVLVDSYGVEFSRAEGDVESFLQELAAQGLLERNP